MKMSVPEHHLSDKARASFTGTTRVLRLHGRFPHCDKTRPNASLACRRPNLLPLGPASCTPRRRVAPMSTCSPFRGIWLPRGTDRDLLADGILRFLDCGTPLMRHRRRSFRCGSASSGWAPMTLEQIAGLPGTGASRTQIMVFRVPGKDFLPRENEAAYVVLNRLLPVRRWRFAVESPPLTSTRNLGHTIRSRPGNANSDFHGSCMG
ncbi:hypothetical protein C8Q79DRAFT_497234 [Trametes meyenii]|nr:hypothetical protein C8Q79DRAFT_497234 [Trametes meyenii]